MSKYGIKYEIKFTNAEKHLEASPDFALEGQEINIGIYDRSYLIDDGDAVTVHSMTPSGDPFHLQSVDNDEDKFTAIRPIQAKVQFLSDNDFNLATFTDQPPIGDDPGDPRWYVEIKIDTKFIFKGFLVLDDCFEAFMPTPNIVTLTAADGLAFIKNTALVDEQDLNPTGYYRIADFLSMALRKTGLSLNLNVVFNIRGAIQGTTPTSIEARWVKIEYNSGGSFHYFLDLGSSGFYDVTVQPTPPPYPATYNLVDLVFVAAGPANFAIYVSSHYPDWINGIQYPGDIAVVTGDIPSWTDNGHLYDKYYLNSKTFEDKIGTCINGWDVIAKILGEEAYLTQRCGEWWILRVDEIEELIEYNVAKFLPDGKYDSIVENSSAYGLFIAKDLYTMLFSDEATEVLQSSQHKFVKETYKFETPIELICNIDFSRGDFIGALPNETVDGVDNDVLSYGVECWTLMRELPPVALDAATVYVKKYFINGTEREHFLHSPLTPTDSFYYLNCNDKTAIQKRDKFNLTVSFRYDTNWTTGITPVSPEMMMIRLYGDDGTFWYCGIPTLNPVAFWVQSDSTWTTPYFPVHFQITDGMDITNWTSITVDAPPAPVSGLLEFSLINGGNGISSVNTTVTKDFTSLSFDYIPYLNGQYQKYEGIYDKVERTINFRAVRDKQVYISDGIKPLFRGALFKTFSIINYTDNTNFTTEHTFIVPGDRTLTFISGKIFELRNYSLNQNVFVHVLSSSYDVGLNQTTVTVRETLAIESGTPTEFYDVTFVLDNHFFNWKAARTPTADQIHTYLHLQTFDVWNQYRNVMQIFRAQCWGLQSFVRDHSGDAEINYPSLIHTYYLQDPHALTFNRRFILLNFDQDWYKCEWKGTLVETFKSDRPKSYEGTDGEEVKYE